MEIEQGNSDEIELKNEITVPNITGQSLEEAENILKEYKLEMYINNEKEEIDKKNTLVTNQIPQAGITVYEGSCIYIN